MIYSLELDSKRLWVAGKRYKTVEGRVFSHLIAEVDPDELYPYFDGTPQYPLCNHIAFLDSEVEL